jgi:hypothetical protein
MWGTVEFGVFYQIDNALAPSCTSWKSDRSITLVAYKETTIRRKLKFLTFVLVY